MMDLEKHKPVEKHYHFETVSIAAVVIALVGLGTFLEMNGHSSTAAGFFTCALLLGMFKLV